MTCTVLKAMDGWLAGWMDDFLCECPANLEMDCDTTISWASTNIKSDKI